MRLESSCKNKTEVQVLPYCVIHQPVRAAREEKKSRLGKKVVINMRNFIKI